MKTTTALKTCYFETGLLWIDDHPILPHNCDMIIKHFKVLENLFCKNPEYLQMYEKQIDDIKLGHTKLLSEEDSSKILNKTNYKPHLGVVNINEHGTVWVVFKASVNCHNISLSNKLLTRIDYLNRL